MAAAELDPWGNAYPAQCTKDASIAAARQLPVIPVGSLPVVKGGGDRCGFFDPRFDPPVISILKRCVVDGREVSRDDVLHHEGCHRIMQKLTGRPDWHD